MALGTGALIDVNEYQVMTGRDVNEDDLNTGQREVHINAASDAIKDYIGRHICPVASGTSECFTGDDSISYLVKGCNISSISGLYYWTGTDWKEMTTASYPRTNRDRRVWFTGGGTFWKPSEAYLYNFKLVYTMGYDRDNVPAALKRACVALVQRSLMNAEGKEGFLSSNVGDVSNSYNLSEQWPGHVKALLAPWKCCSFGVI